MERLLSKFKQLGNSDFQEFQISEHTIRRLKESGKAIDDVVKNSNKAVKPKTDQYRLVLENYYKVETRKNYFSNPTSVKKLCWAIDYKDNVFTESILDKGQLISALNLIEDQFSSSCYTALIFVLFSNWRDTQADVLRKYLKNRLQTDANKRAKIRYFQENIEFISQSSGPINWANKFHQTSEWDLAIFFQKNPFISFTRGTVFFKIFFIQLFEKAIEKSSLNEIETWQGLISLSNESFDKSVTKYLISLVITKYQNEIQGGIYKDLIKNQAFEMIGDPSSVSLWTLPSNEFDSRQIRTVENSRLILNKWINEALVDLFFSQVVDDYTRKRFWMKYVPEMRTVDIFLSVQKLEEIFQDNRIKSGLENRFGVLYSGGNTSSIIIFSIKQYRFILAGSYAGGALYVHPNTSDLYPKIEDLESNWPVNGKRLRRLNKSLLIHPYLPNLISTDSYYNYFADEGRLTHNGNWEYRLDDWMKNKIG